MAAYCIQGSKRLPKQVEIATNPTSEASDSEYQYEFLHLWRDYQTSLAMNTTVAEDATRG